MIGKIIYDHRKKKGLTLSELAERASVSKSYLSNIERNLNQNPSIRVIRKIANVLEIELKTLLKTDVKAEDQDLFDKEWIDIIKDLRESGIDKNSIKEYKTLIEFIKWQNRSE